MKLLDSSSLSATVSMKTFASEAVAATTGPCGFSRAIRLASRQIGSPSLRQNSAKVQRGRLSPGYHLPWP